MTKWSFKKIKERVGQENNVTLVTGDKLQAFRHLERPCLPLHKHLAQSAITYLK